MLAILGWVFPEVAFHLPADAYSATNPLYAVGKVGWLPVIQILLFIAACEAPSVKKVYEDNCSDPGNYNFDPFGFAKDPRKKANYQLAEIKNGRLAMIAIGGAIHHALLTNVGMIEQISSGKWSKLFPLLISIFVGDMFFLFLCVTGILLTFSSPFTPRSTQPVVTTSTKAVLGL